MAPARTLFCLEVGTCTPARGRGRRRERVCGSGVGTSHGTRAAVPLRARSGGRDRRRGAGPGHQGRSLLRRGRPGPVPDERERARQHGAHLVPGPRHGGVDPGAPREHRHRGVGDRAGALPGRGPGRRGGARERTQAAGADAAAGRAHAQRPLVRLQRARLRGPASSAPHGRPAERPARPADRGGGRGRAAGQGGGADRHADAAARRGRRRGHQLRAWPTPRAAHARCGGRGPSSRTRARSASSRWATRGTSAARSCSTARWSGSSSRRRHTPRAPSSWTRRCRSSSA